MWQPTAVDISESDKAKPKILMQVFSYDSKYMACMDEFFAVTLIAYDHKPFFPLNPKEW
jgi:hypothetical protein